MIDHYLRFVNKETAINRLVAARFSSIANKFYTIDFVGTLYTPAIYDETGIIEDPVALDGYHVNIRMTGADIPNELGAYEIFPSNPQRKFAE